MALMMVFGAWLSLGAFVYRAHKSDGSFRAEGYLRVIGSVGSWRVETDIPDASPSARIEAYRTDPDA